LSVDFQNYGGKIRGKINVNPPSTDDKEKRLQSKNDKNTLRKFE